MCGGGDGGGTGGGGEGGGGGMNMMETSELHRVMPSLPASHFSNYS